MSYWSEVVSPTPYRPTPRHLLCIERDKVNTAARYVKNQHDSERSTEERRMLDNACPTHHITPTKKKDTHA